MNYTERKKIGKIQVGIHLNKQNGELKYTPLIIKQIKINKL